MIGALVDWCKTVFTQSLILDTRRKIWLLLLAVCNKPPPLKSIQPGQRADSALARLFRLSPGHYAQLDFIAILIRQHQFPGCISLLETWPLHLLSQWQSAGSAEARWEPFIILPILSKHKTLQALLQITSDTLGSLAARSSIAKSTHLGSVALMWKLEGRHGEYSERQ